MNRLGKIITPLDCPLLPTGDATAKTVVAMVGKFCITATFNIVYLWTSEMYPTPVRYRSPIYLLSLISPWEIKTNYVYFG